MDILIELISGGANICFTVIGGVMVFIGGQISIKFFIDPIQEQTKLIQKIATDLTFYQNRIGYGNELEREILIEIIDTFRGHASNLRASAWTIKWYRLWNVLGFALDRADVIEASKELIGLSNSMTARDGLDWQRIRLRQDTIKELLNFE